MKNRYHKIMEHITVTQEMHDRIVKNVDQTDFDAKQANVLNLARYRKYMAMAACLILLVVSATMIPKLMKSNNDPPDLSVASNIVKYATIEELSDAVGFDVPEITQIPFAVKEVTYTAYWKKLAEIDYKNKEKSIVLRKSIGSEDNSGDYNSYSTIKKETIKDLKVTIKGNSGSYQLAIWETGGYSYSIQLTTGVLKAELLDMVKSIQ